jgi:Right handed beta helix region
MFKDFDGDAVQITGRNITIENCPIDGGGGAHRGNLITIANARGVVIRNCKLTGASGVAVAIYHSSDVHLMGNTFSGNLGSAVFAQDGLNGIEIASNTIDTSSAAYPGIDTIGVHTYGDGGTASNIRIHDNHIVHGGDNFAIEIGAFGAKSVPPDHVTSENNSINMVRDSNGAFSYSTLNSGSVSGNRIDAGGHYFRIGAVELVTATGVAVANNVLTGIGPRTAYTVSINGSSRNVFRDNVFEGGIYIGTSRPESPEVVENVIEGNTLTAMPAAVLNRGLIWFQCNTFHGSVSRNVVRSNVLRGNPTGPAVLFENDYWQDGARVDANEASSNRISGSSGKIGIGPHVTNTRLN